MGHEASGTVHTVGDLVSSLKPGDRVAIEPGIPCRRCGHCKSGHYNLCACMMFAADPPHVHGTLSKYFCASEDFCHKLPDTVSLAAAPLVEPLAVAVHSVRLTAFEHGAKVVVFGAGTVGLLCAAVAREFGASRIVSVDLLQRKLDFAEQFIGSSVISTNIPDTSISAEENAQNLIRKFGLGEGADVAIDASGAESSVQTALYALRPGGTYIQTGMGKREINFPIAEMCERELVVKGSFRYGPGDFGVALSLVGSGKVNLNSLISKEFPFEEAIEAWEATHRGEGIKNLIRGPQD